MLFCIDERERVTLDVKKLGVIVYFYPLIKKKSVAKEYRLNPSYGKIFSLTKDAIESSFPFL